MGASIRGNLYQVCLLGVEVTKNNHAVAGNINIQAELTLSIS